MHKTQLRDMHTSAETTEARLLDASHRQEQDVHSRLAELDMVAADLTRANERVAVVERRNVSSGQTTQRVGIGADNVGTASCRDRECQVRISTG